jgi:hypothetical protein
VTKHVRRFAIAILLIALPMQGMAAASMLYCEGDHHATWLQVATQVIFAQMQSDSQTERTTRQVAGREAIHDASDVDHHDETFSDGDDHSGSQCSSCSDCCCAASLPGSAQVALAPIQPLNGPIPTVAALVSGGLPERLERPPRNTLV